MLGFLGSFSRGYSSSKKTISDKIAEKFATFSKGKINNIPKVNRSNIGVNFDYGFDAIASSNNFDKDFNKHRDRVADDYAQKVESFASQTVNNDRSLPSQKIAEQEKESFKEFFNSLKGDYQDYKKYHEALLENSSKIDEERKSQTFNQDSYTRSQTSAEFTSPHHLNPDPTPHKTKPAQPGIFSGLDRGLNEFVADVNRAAALREAQERQKAQAEDRQKRAKEQEVEAKKKAAAESAAAAASAAAAQQAVKEEQLKPVFFGDAANSHQASGNKRPADNNDPNQSGKKQKTEEFNFGNIFPLPFSLSDLFQASPTPASPTPASSPQASSPRANSSSTNSSPASSTFSWSNPFLASPTPASSSPANSSSANSSSANSSSVNSPPPWGGVENLFNPTSWFGAQKSAEKSSPSPETRSPVSPSPVGPSSGSSLRPSATNSPASLTTSQSSFGGSIFASPSAGSSSGSSNPVYSNTPSFDGRQVSKIVDALTPSSKTPESNGPTQLTFNGNNNGQIKLSDGFILTLQGNKVSTIAKGATNKWYNPQFFQNISAKEIQVKGNGDIAFSHSGNSYSLPKSQIDKAIMSQGGGKSPAVGARRGPGSSGRSR
jgi:hypothetical protein